MNCPRYYFTSRKYYSLLTVGLVLFTCVSCQSTTPFNKGDATTQSAHFRDGKFFNESPTTPPDYQESGYSTLISRISKSLSQSFSAFSRFLFVGRKEAVPPEPVPVKDLSREYLESLPDNKTTIIRMGHSTVLLKINGEYWLTDPIFSKRASRFQFTGPKRFHKLPINIEELPNLRGVIISHNHYDHLDENTIKQLKSKVTRFYVPLKNGAILEKWGISRQRISEMDWWQSKTIGDITLTATPSKHFSGRGYSDSNESLWSSWVITTRNSRIFFSGDSGYFPGFKDIGFKYGPFDLTIMAIGGYDEDDLHMRPEQALQAHIDLNGTLLLPVNNATFDLAFHSWFDPLEQISNIGKKRGQIVVTPIMGQAITIGNAESTVAATQLDWWTNVR